MTPVPRAALALLALLAACKSPSPTPVADRPAPPSAPAPALSSDTPSLLVPPAAASDAGSPRPIAPITAATAALVWQNGQGSFKTVWVESGPSGPAIKRERAEPVVATGHGLYAIRVHPGGIASVDAEPLAGGPEIHLTVAVAESAYEKDPQSEVAITGAVGPLVFSEGRGWFQQQDAPHPMWTDSRDVYDLEAGHPVTLAPFPGLPRLTAFARNKFQTRYGDAGDGCILDISETPSFSSATFAYDSRGMLRGRYIFTMPSNYMCGTGPGHYTTTEEVFDSTLPDAVLPWKVTPPWLPAYLAKHPSIGVSPIPVELDATAAAATFEKAPVPPAPKP